MTIVHFIADGPRDGATISLMVSNVLGIELKPVIHAWKAIRLNSRKGYERMLLYAISRAIDAEASGIVAVVDRDKSEKERQATHVAERSRLLSLETFGVLPDRRRRGGPSC